jgi:CRISPR-associated endonuclease/helicase Cas3
MEGGDPVTHAPTAIAHSRNHAGQRHGLHDHIAAVTDLATTAAEVFGAGELARWAGLWHDLGKFHPEFQQYLLDAEDPATRKRRGPDHKAAGASLAARYAPLLAQVLVGHHGGLRDQQGELLPWLTERLREERVAESLAIARATLPELEPPGRLAVPDWAKEPLAAELFIRMLFSCLVDADFLDTEAHFNPERAAARGGDDLPHIPEVLAELERSQAALSGHAADPVNAVRHLVYRDCLRAAELPPGFFRLTVPTGGGKTRSGLAFGLRHAVRHDLRRVIVAIPYTSITDQTAATYRAIFSDPRAVLEHHSAVQRDERADEDSDPDTTWERLAAENWDAPIVVTTTVQLFESLLGRTTSTCRKLHNIARSVVILDEAQTLPERLLEPILDVLRELVAHYGVTVVLSTATQPALDEHPGFRGLPGLREIVTDPPAHFARLRRVTYEHPTAAAGPWTWARVAEEVRASPQALAIVNTKNDALALLDALDDPAALHLSTLLCGAHRRDVLAEVRRRLQVGEPCHLIATQVVEAGVDLDFPLVLRAAGPLDRIVQAAGRCNREGRLATGRVVIFDPAEGGLPPGAYRTGSDITALLLADPTFDFHDPAVYADYFRRLYGSVALDQKGIQASRARLDYRTVSERFRLIDDHTVSVLVNYWQVLPDGREVSSVIDALRNRRGNPRLHWRALHPLLVSVRKDPLDAYVQRGLASEIAPGLWHWIDPHAYDLVRGLVIDRRNHEAFVV